MTGDGELQEGQYWESLGRAAQRGTWARSPSIVDHNKIQSDTWVERRQRPRRPGGQVRAPSAGPSRAATATTSPRSAGAAASCPSRPEPPAVLIADTVKGAGAPSSRPTSLARRDRLYRVPLAVPRRGPTTAARIAELVATRKPSSAERAWTRCAEADAAPRRAAPPTGEQLVDAYGDALVAAGRPQRPDRRAGRRPGARPGLIPFSQRIPDRFVECGIAEQDMVSKAGGLAYRGHAAVRALVLLLPARPAERADLQQRHRGPQGDLRRLARRVCSPPRPAIPTRPCGT